MYIAYDTTNFAQLFKYPPILKNGEWVGEAIETEIVNQADIFKTLFGQNKTGYCEVARVVIPWREWSWETRNLIPDRLRILDKEYEVVSINKYGVDLQGYGSATWHELRRNWQKLDGSPFGVE